MFERIEARAVAVGEARAHDVVEKLADAIDVPGVRAEPVAGGVLLSGRGLYRRWIGDAALRWIAGWLA